VVTTNPAPGPGHGFDVHLDNFEGPFDLLLSLIAKHQLDVTEIALSKVTDDFIAHIRGRTVRGDPAVPGACEWDLGQATEFLVVAATLLDLKAARLLPAGAVEDEDDLALLDAGDLLFARLLQYRAFKQVAGVLAARLAAESRHHPRTAGLEAPYSDLLPEVLLGLGPVELAGLAARTLAPRPAPTLSTGHVHPVRVSVREQADLLVHRLRRTGTATFRELTEDCEGTLLVVARFLALLELYREAAVSFEQETPLGELHVRWTGAGEGEVGVSDEYDDQSEFAARRDSDVRSGAGDSDGSAGDPDGSRAGTGRRIQREGAR
jgi:segregation and condensation protein A